MLKLEQNVRDFSDFEKEEEKEKKKKKGKVGGTRSAKNIGASGAVCGCSSNQRRRVNVLRMQCLDNKLLLKKQCSVRLHNMPGNASLWNICR